MYAFDLEELRELDNRFWFFGYNRFSLVSIYDRDYFQSDEPGTIQDKLYRTLSQEGINTSDISSVSCVTAARFLSYVFNPVSFFICYRQNNEILCVVAEVNNTFRERHLYILRESDLVMEPQQGSETQATWIGARQKKSFHVSPFHDMNGYYVFKLQAQPDTFRMHISIEKNEQEVFAGSIDGDFTPLSAENFRSTLLRHPLSAWLTYPRILWQAGKLYFMRRLNVYTKPHPESEYTIVQASPGWLEKVSRNFFDKMISKIEHGKVTVTYPDGESVVYDSGESAAGSANLNIKNYRFFKKVIFAGDVGAGESFMLGDWESPDVTALLKVFLANRHVIEPRKLFAGKLSRVLNWFVHRLRKNTVTQSRKNIGDHYDLSNDMFRTFLDDTMSYSCALYQSDSESLKTAQINKIERILTQAELAADHHVLEIGCGWGSLAIEAVKRYGCRFTCLTLSEEQREYALARVQEEGLQDKIEVLLVDYRTIAGTYDRIISVEMIEAVGREFLPEYFKICERLLKPGGRVVIQAITMPDERMDQYGKNCDWIQKYIFPGCFVPSLELLQREVVGNTKLRVEDVFKMKAQYERTLLEWKNAFRAKKKEIFDLGFDTGFFRRWLYYFSYCEAGFSSEVLNTYQLVLSKEEH